MLNQKTLSKVADIYGLGHMRSVRKLHGGLQTPKMLLETSKGNFVVSKHTLSDDKKIISKSRRSLAYEIELLGALKALPVPHFIASKNGEYVAQVDDDWYTVDRFIPGKRPAKITAKMAYQLGSFLGAFHKTGSNFTRNVKARRRFYDLNKEVLEQMYKEARRQSNPILKTVVDEVKEGVERSRLPKSLPRGPIHVDIKPDNELFVGERLAAVLDFGNFYIDTFLIDVGKTIMWNCVSNSKLDEKLIHEFVKGYEKKRKLSANERKYLDQAINFAIYSHIWVDLYHTPLKYVPESYTLGLVKTFLPIARKRMQQTKQ